MSRIAAAALLFQNAVVTSMIASGGGVRPVRRPVGAWLAVVVIIAVAGCRFVLPDSHRTMWWYDLVVFDVPLVAALVLVIGGAILFRRRPRLLVDRRRGVLVAPARAWWIGCEVSAQVLVLAQLGWTLARTHPIGWALWVLYGVAALVVTGRVGIWLLGRPRVELSPTGVRVVDPVGEWSVPWEAIAVGPRLRPPGSPDLLTVDRADLLIRRGLTLRPRRAVHLPTVDTTATFLAHAMNYYLDHPQERETIATAAGYERLLQWMRTAPS